MTKEDLKDIAGGIFLAVCLYLITVMLFAM